MQLSVISRNINEGLHDNVNVYSESFWDSSVNPKTCLLEIDFIHKTISNTSKL